MTRSCLQGFTHTSSVLLKVSTALNDKMVLFYHKQSEQFSSVMAIRYVRASQACDVIARQVESAICTRRIVFAVMFKLGYLKDSNAAEHLACEQALHSVDSDIFYTQ